MNLATSVALALVLVVPANSVAAQQPAPYRIDWLGEDFFPHAINDRGQVVGYRLPRGVGHSALLWQGGVVTDLGPGEGHDINNAGDIVIARYRPDPVPATILHADGRRTPLPVARPWGADFRHQYSINDHGTVVGMEQYAEDRSEGRPFVWDGGTGVTYPDLSLPQQIKYGAGHAVSNAGHVAGWWDTGSAGGGFVMKDGVVTRWGVAAVSVNDRGQVLTLDAQVWEDDQTTTVLDYLPLLPASDEESGVSQHAGEINNLGQVAGWQEEMFLIDPESGHGTTQRAFLWDPAGGTRDLNALMGFERGSFGQFPLARVMDLNDVGQIVGYGSQGAWVLTPVPEPSGAGAVLFAAGAASLRRTRGKRFSPARAMDAARTCR